MSGSDGIALGFVGWLMVVVTGCCMVLLGFLFLAESALLFGFGLLRLPLASGLQRGPPWILRVFVLFVCLFTRLPSS